MEKKLNLRLVLDVTASALAKAGVDSARREARRLVCWAVGCDAAGLILIDTLSEHAVGRLASGVAQRCARKPLALIEGQTEFWTLSLKVSEDTLIHRGDSETIIETLLRLRPERERVLSVLDLGTGTGCLLLAALSEYPQAYGIGVELSSAAARLASYNARRNNLSDRAAFIVGDWFSPLTGCFNVILSNPPYIPAEDIVSLMPEVRDYEPQRALVGGEDGLVAYRQIFSQAAHYLPIDGLLIVEIGQGQEVDVEAIARGADFSLIEACVDLGGIVRVLAFANASSFVNAAD